MRVLVVLVCLLLCSEVSAIDKSVCTPYAPGTVKIGPKKPTLPTSFTARVECNLLTKARTTDVIEYYDELNNRGAVYQTEEGVTGSIIYDYDTDEIFTVDPTKATKCYTDELTEDNNDFLFGYKHQNQTTRIFSPSAALRFGGTIVENYLGKSVIRGIVVDGWKSCSFWPDLDATSEVTWYFSAADEWTEATAPNQVPVRCEIVGKSHDSSGGTSNYHHIYEFTHFRPYIEGDADSIFETPQGVVCKNRKSIKMVPMMPQFFKFEAEIIQEESKILSYIAEWYDYSARLVRFDYTPFGSEAGKFAVAPTTEIHDFNTGVRYVIDRLRGNCTPEVIDPTGFDAASVNPQTVRMRNARQFFDIDGTFQYEGTHTDEGLSCDGWVGQKVNFPPGISASTVEWFMTNNEWILGGGEQFNTIIPRRMEITSQDGTNLHYVYNIFNFMKSEPFIWDFNVTGCFPYQRHIQFTIAGSYDMFLRVTKQTFEYALYKAITKNAVVSPLRVANLKVDYNEDSLIVTFTLLDVAPIAGDVVKGATETPLDVAANNLYSKINAGQFIVSINQPTPHTYTAHPMSAKTLEVREWRNMPRPSPPTVYTPGAMAALGVVMVIIGMVTGCVVIIFIYRKNGGSFGKKSENLAKNDLETVGDK